MLPRPGRRSETSPPRPRVNGWSPREFTRGRGGLVWLPPIAEVHVGHPPNRWGTRDSVPGADGFPTILPAPWIALGNGATTFLFSAPRAEMEKLPTDVMRRGRRGLQSLLASSDRQLRTSSLRRNKSQSRGPFRGKRIREYVPWNRWPCRMNRIVSSPHSSKS